MTTVAQPEIRPEVTRKKKKRMSPMSVIFSIIGLVLLLYPVLGTIYENHQQTGEVQVYSQQISEISSEQLNAQMAEARRWNEEYPGGPILDPWLQRVTEDNVNYQEYLKQLALTEVMGRITIPSIKSDLPIYHGSTEDVLSKGIGHLYGSGLPVGGIDNHTVLTGHTGLSVATLWDNLVNVKTGDAIYLTVSGEKLKYVVTSTEVVLPEETDSLRPVVGKDMLTLITCTPYGVNSHRLLVHAQRAPMDVEDQEKLQTIGTIKPPMQWWMIAALIVAGIVILLMLVELIRTLLARRNSDEKEEELEVEA